MIIRRFIMEDWLAGFKDRCKFNLGESGMPDLLVGDILEKCSLPDDCLRNIALKDNDTRGTENLRQSIADTYGCDVASDNIICTTGTSEALFILFSILSDGKKNAVVPFPSFQALYDVPGALGNELRFYQLTFGKGFKPDADEVCSLIGDETGFVVINTPHNPSGITMDDQTAKAIIEKAEFHGVPVISDEHYRFLPLDGGNAVKSFAQPYGNVFATGSITKCFGMAGLRAGWIVAPQNFVTKICDFRDYLTHTLSPVSDFLAASVLKNSEIFINENIEILKNNLLILEKMISETPSLSMVKPEAGIVAFPKYDFDTSSEDFSRKLIEEQDVFVLPGSAFETEKHFRINLGMKPSLFEEAIERIGNFCREMERKS